MTRNNNWFKSDHVADKWLEGALEEMENGKFKSRVHPFIRQWGTAHWNLSVKQLYQLADNFKPGVLVG